MKYSRFAKRWSGEGDHYFGPFTYHHAEKKGWRPFSLILGSGDGEDYAGAYIRFSALGHTLICALPQKLLKPAKEWVDTSKYEWSKGPRSGYWDQHEREYGFTISDGHWTIKYGRQTNDSSTEKSFGGFLQWTQWRLKQYRMLHIDGEVCWSHGPGRYPFKESSDARVRVRTATYAFKDYDGEENSATAYIEEWEWTLGEGVFKWLRFFTRPRFRRSLCVNFGKEVGNEKGSWKGGAVGMSANIEEGWTPEQAWLSLCQKERLTPLTVSGG